MTRSHLAASEAPTKAARDHSRDNILRITEVQRRTGLSRSTIHRRAAARTFPSKVQIGENSVGWYESEIDAFVANPMDYRA